MLEGIKKIKMINKNFKGKIYNSKFMINIVRIKVTNSNIEVLNFKNYYKNHKIKMLKDFLEPDQLPKIKNINNNQYKIRY